MSLTYNLTLNTQSTSSSIINKTNLAQVQYNVNWDAVLPRKFQEYQIVWTLKSVNLTSSQFQATLTGTGLTLTVTSIIGGSLNVGNQFYIGTNLVTIASQTSGTIGGIGVYVLNAYTGAANNATPLLYQTVTSLNENLFVDINFGSSNTYEFNQMTTKIGFVYPNVVQQTSATWSYFYQATVYDNPPTEISYPSNNIITVKLYRFDGTSAPTQTLDYVLELSFTPIQKDLILL